MTKIDKYNYCGFDYVYSNNQIKYLRLYEQYPQIEYLAKFGFGQIMTSVTILRLIGKDKGFIRWLMQNHERLVCGDHYVRSIVKAYKTKQELWLVDRIERDKLRLQRDAGLKIIPNTFKGSRLLKVMEYIADKDISLHSYKDYLEACVYLKLDMSLDKNACPHDFKKWHDIRIDEYKTAKALQVEQEKQRMYEQFASVANKYIELEYSKKGDYAIVIAKSPQELIKEGEVLHHCVGKMNYDQKFMQESSLIFFIRNKADMDSPFVTMEYSIQECKILQCYGENNTKPSEQVLDFVNKVWLPYANRRNKKILKNVA